MTLAGRFDERVATRATRPAAATAVPAIVDVRLASARASRAPAPPRARGSLPPLVRTATAPRPSMAICGKRCARLRRLEQLRADPSACQRLAGVSDVGVARLAHEQRAGCGQRARVRVRATATASRRNALRPSRIDRIGAVAAADDARVIGGARARVRRAVRVDQRDAMAALREKPPGAPGAEDTGAD